MNNISAETRLKINQPDQNFKFIPELDVTILEKKLSNIFTSSASDNPPDIVITDDNNNSDELDREERYGWKK